MLTQYVFMKSIFNEMSIFSNIKIQVSKLPLFHIFVNLLTLVLRQLHSFTCFCMQLVAIYCIEVCVCVFLMFKGKN